MDDSREIVGVEEDTERVQERLTSFLQTGCSSPVNASVGSHEDPKGRIHWIEVPRQRGFEPLRYGGRVWVRRQRSSVEPSSTELQELYNALATSSRKNAPYRLRLPPVSTLKPSALISDASVSIPSMNPNPMMRTTSAIAVY